MAALTVLPEPAGLSPDDAHALAQAYDLLERPSFAARVSSLIGAPLAQGFKLLPRTWQVQINRASDRAMSDALDVATHSLHRAGPAGMSDRTSAIGLGALAGFVGLPALAIELPLTTVVLLRAIAREAAAQGEDLDGIDARLACLEVFVLGSPNEADDDADLGFFELRAASAVHFARAGVPLIAAGEPGLPATVALVRSLARRFGIVVGEKAAAQAVPLFGAAAGAGINALFFHHFTDIARGHFTVRRLERTYGASAVQAAYESLHAAASRARHESFAQSHAARRASRTTSW